MQDVTRSSARGGGIESLVDDNESRCKKIFKALTSTLLPAFNEDDPFEFFDNPARRYEYFNLLVKFMEIAPQDFFKGKLENYLTCFAVSSYLKENFLDEYFGGLFEEFSLNALYKSVSAGCSIADSLLLIDELPKILKLNYPIVKNIRDACIQIIPQLMMTYRLNNHWQGFTELDYILKLLKAT